MADLFEQLKQKYQPVLDTIQKDGAQLQNLNLDGNQLCLKATAVSEASKNRIWDAIKTVPEWRNDIVGDIKIDPNAPAPAAAVTYTVKAGDTLSKIAKEQLGNANAYTAIFEANRDQLSDPDKIKPGQVLKIPAAH